MIAGTSCAMGNCWWVRLLKQPVSCSPTKTRSSAFRVLYDGGTHHVHLDVQVVEPGEGGETGRSRELSVEAEVSRGGGRQEMVDLAISTPDCVGDSSWARRRALKSPTGS